MFLSLNPFNITFSSARSQGEALIQWKNSLVHSPTSVESWSVENINNLCNWTSVACDGAGMVSELNLSPSVACLKLVYLDLSDNYFKGNIPSELGQLPELRYLNLIGPSS